MNRPTGADLRLSSVYGGILCGYHACMGYTLRFLWNATRGHRLAPWRSPYLLWRIETYTGVKMKEIGFLEFWEDVRRSVKKLGLKVDIDQQGFHSQVREVLFYDTPDFDLYNNHFILRKRTFYDEGWPRADHELTLKYRNPDLKAAAKVDVRPRLGGQKEIKFKEELLLERDHLGGMRSVYSHGCVLVSPKIELDRGIENIAGAFPALQSVDIRPKAKIELVNSVAVEEVQNTIGFIHFDHHYKGKATIAIWRNRALAGC